MANTIRSRPRGNTGNISDTFGDTGVPGISTLNACPPSSIASSPPASPLPQGPSQGSSTDKPPRKTKRKKFRSFYRRYHYAACRHTWLIPLCVLVVSLTAYLVYPHPANPMHKAIFLSYALPAYDELIPSYARYTTTETYYGKGLWDVVFVAFYTTVFSFTREFLMQRVLRPLAIRGGVRTRRKQDRFMEQAYTACYFAIFGPYGLYIMSRTPVWYFNTQSMYEDFPHRSHDALFKAYYLLQASYWAQQALVLLLGLEKPRKDYVELVGHHVVTLLLIALSYYFHFTYMGLAVYITHDVSDYFLATAKALNYLDSPYTTPYFSFFVLVWIYLRHFINLEILYSILTEYREVGPFELNWEKQQYKCWISQYITGFLLICLQGLNLYWCKAILRIAINGIKGKEVKDERSDDEALLKEDAANEEQRVKRDEEFKLLFKSRFGGKENVKAANGQAAEGHESYKDAVVEGKKEI